MSEWTKEQHEAAKHLAGDSRSLWALTVRCTLAEIERLKEDNLSLRDWMEPVIDQMECRQDNECDHCLGQIILGGKHD